MEIITFDKENPRFITAAAELLVENFPHSYSENPIDEINNCLEIERIALIAVENGELAGFVGAIPQYGTTGWELHPLVVKKSHQFKGIGTMLVKALEDEIARRGGITVYLGSDDESGKTSLSDTDLFVDTYKKIENVKNLGKHPYEFYQKLGYKIVGIIPDANGIGKPDIIMAKRII